jgi:hypothetical protein
VEPLCLIVEVTTPAEKSTEKPLRFLPANAFSSRATLTQFRRDGQRDGDELDQLGIEFLERSGRCWRRLFDLRASSFDSFGASAGLMSVG